MSKKKNEVEEINPEDLHQNFSNKLKSGDHGEETVKRKIKVQFDIEYGGHPGKEMDGVSMTQPDLNITVRQLLENHTRGNSGEINVRQPMYWDTEIPTLNDLADMEAYQEHLARNMASLKENIKAERFERESKAKQKAKTEEAKKPKPDNEKPEAQAD